MAQEFKLPDLGEGVKGGDVVKVLVAAGDMVRAEQPVMEIETDKAVVEVPCPFAGKVAQVHVAQGEKVKVGQTLITVDAAGTSEGPAPASAAIKGAESAGPALPSTSKSAATQVKKAAPAASHAATPPAPAGSVDDTPVAAGPATRRLARELGVNLHEVASFRPGARLTEEDVKEYVKHRMTSAPAGGAAAGAAAMPPLPDFAQWGPVERVAMSSLQRKTAELLLASWVGPHVTQFDEADITDLEALRKRHRTKAGDAGVKLTVTAFVIKAAALALKAYPQFNSSYDASSGELIFKKYYHIGVAVDTPAGLMVPIIRDVDSKRVLEIAEEMNQVAERTRQRKVTRDEMRGGTFTITNLGGIGGTAFTPIVNYPEVAILGLARSREQPVIRDGQWATRLVLPLCLSYDHRIINGADGARFTRKLVELLEDPELLLLEG